MSLPTLTVYIANMAEDVWQYLSTLPPKAKTVDIRGCDLTSDRELSAFLDTPNLLLITPIGINPHFIRYMQNLKRKDNLKILVPKTKTGKVSLDVSHDAQIIQQIITLSQKYQIRLESYTASREFIALVDTLQAKNPDITAPLTPRQRNQSVVDFFGSKSGLRTFYEKNKALCPDFVMPQGKICRDKSSALRNAQTLYEQSEGVVFKTPKGHSGIGVVIVKPTDPVVDFDTLLKEPYWNLFPIIVEAYVPINHAIGGGTPNAEYLVDEKGQTKLLYVCGMRMDKFGYFRGMEIGPNVLPKTLVAKLTAVGNFLGTHYAQMGYHGYFDVDGMIDKNGNLLISESNVRRTGGTHVFHLAQTLLGDNFATQCYLLSNNYYPLPKCVWTLSKILKLLQPILYKDVQKSGLIVTGALTLKDNFLSYVILADNKTEALIIEEKMKALAAG